MFRILLIFSDASQVQHIIKGVHLNDMEVKAASITTFEKAMELFRTDPFDMVIADWEIDGVKAVDVIEWFKKGGDTHFVILSDNAYEAMSGIALPAICDDFISRDGETIDQKEEVSVINFLVRKMIRERGMDQVKRLPLDNPLEGEAIIDREGKLLYVNMFTLRMFGFERGRSSLDQMKNMNALDFIHPDDRDAALFKNAHMLQEFGYHRQEFRGVTIDGREIIVEEYATRIRFKGQQAVFVILRDVTEFHDQGKELERAFDRLEILNRITRHDIVNKLTASMGYLELMQLKGSLDQTGIGLAQKLNICLHDIQDMIEFTQDYQEAGYHRPIWSSVLLLEVQARRHAALHEVTMEVELMDIDVFTDPLIEKVLGNLIDNSVRHGGGVSRMKLWDRFEGSDYVLSLEDNGKGIPIGDKEMIFEKGVGVHTGYGLFLVRSILNLTGITIMENGVQGEGAIFEIRFPEGRYKRA